MNEAGSGLLKSSELIKSTILLMNNKFNETSLVVDDLQNSFPDSQASELSFIVLTDYYTMLEDYDSAGHFC